MTKNQLFRKIPPKNVVINILNVFGLKDFDDQRYFSRKDLETLKCVESMNEKIKPMIANRLTKSTDIIDMIIIVDNDSAPKTICLST